MTEERESIEQTLERGLATLEKWAAITIVIWYGIGLLRWWL